MQYDLGELSEKVQAIYESSEEQAIDLVYLMEAPVESQMSYVNYQLGLKMMALA